MTPHTARDLIINFDQGLRDKLQPITLKMRPAFVAKAGKKRTHTPSNEELKETGLRVNPVQIHVSKPESNRPGRLTMDKWGPPVSTKTAPAPGSKDRLRKELAAAVANTVRLQNGQQAEPQKAEESGV